MNPYRFAAAVAATALIAISSARAQDIKIGADLPMSGPNAEYGEMFSSAAALAVDHVNADKMLSKSSRWSSRTARPRRSKAWWR